MSPVQDFVHFPAFEMHEIGPAVATRCHALVADHASGAIDGGSVDTPRGLALKARADEQRSPTSTDSEAADAAAPTGTGLYNLGWALYDHGQADKRIAMTRGSADTRPGRGVTATALRAGETPSPPHITVTPANAGVHSLQ